MVEACRIHGNKVLCACLVRCHAVTHRSRGHNFALPALEQRVHRSTCFILEIDLPVNIHRSAVFCHQFEFDGFDTGRIEAVHTREVERNCLFSAKIAHRSFQQQLNPDLQANSTFIRQESDNIGIRVGVTDSIHLVNQAGGLTVKDIGNIRIGIVQINIGVFGLSDLSGTPQRVCKVNILAAIGRLLKNGAVERDFLAVLTNKTQVFDYPARREAP